MISRKNPKAAIWKIFSITFQSLILLLSQACDAPDQARTAREVKKWNIYVELNNSISRSFFQPLELYFTAFGRAAEYRPAAGRQDLSRFVSAMAPTGDFAKNIAAGQNAAQNAETELDEAARDMLPRLDELWLLLSQSRDYHAARGYTKDNYSQAARIHTRIHKSHAAFTQSYQKFSRLLGKKDAERRKNDIEEMEAQNMRLKSAMLRLVDAARNMQDYLGQNQVSELDPDIFTGLYNAYSQASSAFQLLDPRAEELKDIQGASLEKFKHKVSEVSAALEITASFRNSQKSGDTSKVRHNDRENLNSGIDQLVDIYNLMAN